MDVFRLLQLIDADGLRSLSTARRLPGRRTGADLCQALDAIYNGSIPQLLLDLRRDDLHRLLRRPFRWGNRRYHSPDLTTFSQEQLLKFAHILFVRGEVPPEFGKESELPEFVVVPATPLPQPKPPKAKVLKAAAPAQLQDDDSDGRTVVAPGVRFLITLSHDWSRPRKLGNVLTDLEVEVPERLRTPRFQEVMRRLTALGVEISDAESGALLTPRDSSPGVDAKVRLRKARA
ncbi:hypothetical protein [Corallococcus sp. Z5C101001]|uniref:hypothetical protein n=1 Tax=Corallococcus sp. Z5C101001 TaxID=2596829 RepID=UPI001180544C|nr:hypothetical protein [Corallococcus sp. Z5C101001]TSC27398.1 hypothetical protein FOF48_18310 [Corallococcus sp. Z5C101001]